MANFSDSGHPIFRASGALERGELRCKGHDKKSVHFNGSDENIELRLRTVISTNQPSIYGALAGLLCKELNQKSSEDSTGDSSVRQVGCLAMCPMRWGVTLLTPCKTGGCGSGASGHSFVSCTLRSSCFAVTPWRQIVPRLVSSQPSIYGAGADLCNEAHKDFRAPRKLAALDRLEQMGEMQVANVVVVMENWETYSSGS